MRIAVITIAAGRHAHLLLQQDGLARSPRAPDHYVVVSLADPGIQNVVVGRNPVADVISLPLEDGHLPLAAARNAGAARALASGADLLVFLDVDCVPGPPSSPVTPVPPRTAPYSAAPSPTYLPDPSTATGSTTWPTRSPLPGSLGDMAHGGVAARIRRAGTGAVRTRHRYVVQKVSRSGAALCDAK